MPHSSLPRLIQALTSEPLAIERRFFDAFVGMIRQRGLEGLSFDGPAIHAELGVPEPRPSRTTGGDRSIAVIPIVGAIANRGHSMGAGAMEIGREIDRAAGSSRVDAIVLDIESPGGVVTGTPELAEKVFRARQEKTVVAVANGLMASAAYWIGAAASEVVASPSGRVGSIGVFTTHEDWSRALELEGVVLTEISAGKYKTEGAPWRPLDDEARGQIESEVAEAYKWFVDDVARFRGDSVANVRSGYGEGRVLGAKQAKAAGLINRVATLEETILRLATQPAPRKGAQARAFNAAEVERRQRARARTV